MVQIGRVNGSVFGAQLRTTIRQPFEDRRAWARRIASHGLWPVLLKEVVFKLSKMFSAQLDKNIKYLTKNKA